MVRQTEQKEGVEILEQGNIYFAYRPKVERDEAEGMGDVQRTYLVLSPHGGGRTRLGVIGQKKLPGVGSHDRYWGFIEKVSDDPRDIARELRGEEYETKTRGEREQPGARPAGEGVYAIVKHEDHTHLAYALELPEDPGEPQRALNIREEASYVLSIKNPEKGSPRGAGLEEGADLPEGLQEEFEGRRFAEAENTHLLDRERVEFLLIGADEDVRDELGIDLDPQKEDADHAEIFNELRMRKSEVETEPLLKGEWA